jgi:hypothetical protein
MDAKYIHLLLFRCKRCTAPLPVTVIFENAVLKLKANTMKRQKVFSLALLLIEVAFTLFIAGIVVPSLLRSELATKETLALGSLRAINIAGFAFSYTTQSVGFAILGGLVGTMAALAIHFHTAKPGNTTSTRRTILRAAHLR